MAIDWRLYILFSFFLSVDTFPTKLPIEYLKLKNLPFATLFLCNNYEKLRLTKLLFQNGVRSNAPAIHDIETEVDLTKKLYSTPSGMTGVIIDMRCKKSERILELASENRFFDITKHWMIIENQHFTLQQFENISLQLEPKMFDIDEYLENITSHMARRDRIREFNADLNKEILSDPEVFEMMKPRNTRIENIHHPLSKYINLKAIVDSEVVLMVPSTNALTYCLYQIHRKTVFTKMIIELIGEIKIVNNSELTIKTEIAWKLSAVNRRRNFNGTLIKSTAALLFFDYFSKSGDLTKKKFDYWALVDLQISQLCSQQFNFRMVIKVFDDYGWKVNETFTGMLLYLFEREADMTSGGLYLTGERMEAVTFVTNMWHARCGLIFRLPALSQVSNIFILPFSTMVWLATLSLFFVMGMSMYFQFKAGRQVEKNHLGITISDLLVFLAAVACQQGSELNSRVLSTRLTILVFLISTIFIYSSYTANIVSLLQSPSASINTPKDFADSDLVMGSENVQYQIKLFEEKNSAMLNYLFKKKILNQRLAGQAYMDENIGMAKVRNGLFGFHMELSSASRIISETYEESEKCHLKVINLFPNRFNGHAVPKKSPYREILAQGFRWYDEVGFVSRTEKRFSLSIPKCGSSSGGTFTSISLPDIRFIFILLCYGVITSILVFVLEKIVVNRQKRLNNRKMTRQKFL